MAIQVRDQVRDCVVLDVADTGGWSIEVRKRKKVAKESWTGQRQPRISSCFMLAGRRFSQLPELPETIKQKIRDCHEHAKKRKWADLVQSSTRAGCSILNGK